MVHLFASVCLEVSCGKVPVVHGGVPSRSNPAQSRVKNGTGQPVRRDLEAEETTAWLERESWDDRHGTYDGFIPSKPAALYRFDLRYRRDGIPDHSSGEYLALADELEKLEAEALDVAAEGDNEPDPP
jgi:hypothetical protein